jgi:COP9 signalosome complex subunit 6
MATPMSMAQAQPAAASVPQPSGGEDANGAVAIHPLVVLAISDHFNRFAAMRLFPLAAGASDLENPPPPTLLDAVGGIRVVGLLLGEQNGRTIDVCHSVELPVHRGDDGRAVIDANFMTMRVEQYKTIFPSYDVVGWYTTGASVDDDDLRLHLDVFSALNESPFLLVMDITACMSAFAGRMTGGKPAGTSTPSSAAGPSTAALSCAGTAGAQAAATLAAVPASSTAAPGALTVFQAEMQMVDGSAKTILSPVAHRFASADSERIAVDHVSRHAVPGGGEGSATQHLVNLRRSIQMLSARIDVLVRYLDATVSGAVPVDHELLRKVSAVCGRLPTSETDEFATAFKDEQHDAMVVTYLCGVTKSLCAMNELVDNYSLAYADGSNQGEVVGGKGGMSGGSGGRRRV